MNNAKYNYFKNICEDIKTYLYKNFKDIPYNDLDFNEIYDALWLENSVTGNTSGTYWYSTWDAETALCHNFTLAIEALNELGKPLNFNPESLDVTIRCYLLYDCLYSVLYK